MNFDALMDEKQKPLFAQVRKCTKTFDVDYIL